MHASVMLYELRGKLMFRDTTAKAAFIRDSQKYANSMLLSSEADPASFVSVHCWFVSTEQPTIWMFSHNSKAKWLQTVI